MVSKNLFIFLNSSSKGHYRAHLAQDWVQVEMGPGGPGAPSHEFVVFGEDFGGAAPLDEPRYLRDCCAMIVSCSWLFGWRDRDVAKATGLKRAVAALDDPLRSRACAAGVRSSKRGQTQSKPVKPVWGAGKWPVVSDEWLVLHSNITARSNSVKLSPTKSDLRGVESVSK